jgi:hypothetical protein
MTKKFAGKVAAGTSPAAFKMTQTSCEVTDL